MEMVARQGKADFADVLKIFEYDLAHGVESVLK
jgi:hypothetical protein